MYQKIYNINILTKICFLVTLLACIWKINTFVYMNSQQGNMSFKFYNLPVCSFVYINTCKNSLLRKLMTHCKCIHVGLRMLSINEGRPRREAFYCLRVKKTISYQNPTYFFFLNCLNCSCLTLFKSKNNHIVTKILQNFFFLQNTA